MHEIRATIPADCVPEAVRLAHAAELAAFAPAQATSGGRVMTGRAMETIVIAVDLKARALPAVDAWIKARK